MEYPFNDKIRYFNDEELKHINEFLSVEPEPKKIYENDKGEKRECLRIFLPSGTINKDTHYAMGTLVDGSKAYITANASLTDTRLGRVIYRVEGDKEMKDCTSKEWLVFIGKSKKVKNAPKPKKDPLVKQLLETKKAQAKASKTKDEYEEESKEFTLSKNKKK